VSAKRKISSTQSHKIDIGDEVVPPVELAKNWSTAPLSAERLAEIAAEQRRVKTEELADAIELFIEAKVSETRGFAKWDTVPNARRYLIELLADLI